jgi:hypothetical protein
MPGNRIGTAIMNDVAIDRTAMGRLAKALTFILNASHPTVVALRTASETGEAGDIKKARTLFLKLKPGERQAAMNMLKD